MMFPRLTRLIATTGLAAAGATAHAADALKLIIPTAPGRDTDGYFRVRAKEAEQYLHEPIVVMNVAGAGGSVGVAQMVRANPDGQTVAAVWLGPVDELRKNPDKCTYGNDGAGGPGQLAAARIAPNATRWASSRRRST